MAKTFHEIADDLKAFVIDKHSNHNGLQSVSVQRYNNLSVSMDFKRFKQAHVIIKVGMSEAVFSLPNIQKINGGLGMDERFVLRFLGNDTVIADLDALWKDVKSEDK